MKTYNKIGTIFGSEECMKILMSHEVAKKKLGFLRTLLFYPLIMATRFFGFPPCLRKSRNGREKFIFNELIKNNPKEFLDIGSGYGRMALTICNVINAKGTTVDADCRDIFTLKQLAKELDLNCDGICADILTIRFEKDKFDLIYCIELMEHIQEDEKLLELIHMWLKPGGTFIFQTPFHFKQMPDVTEHEFGHVRNGYSEKSFEKINNGLFNFKYYTIGKRKSCKWCSFENNDHPSKLIGVGKKH